VLTQEEVARLLESASCAKHKAALSVAHGAGLRASEVVSLKVSDIDSVRMVLRVEQGKGRKVAGRYRDLPGGWQWRFRKVDRLEMDGAPSGLGIRSKRYAMLVEDGVVKALHVEDTPRNALESSAERLQADL